MSKRSGGQAVEALAEAVVSFSETAHASPANSTGADGDGGPITEAAGTRVAQLHRNGQALTAALGEVTAVLMRDKRFRHMTLAEIETAVGRLPSSAASGSVSAVDNRNGTPTMTAKIEKPCVWLSKSDTKPELLFGFTCQLDIDDSKALVSRVRAFKRGEALSAEELPSVMWIDPNFATDNRRKLPHLFKAGGFLTVSEPFAEVLRGFDLGRTRLYPVELLHSDRKERFPGSHYLLNITEVHRYFSPEHSARFEPLPNSKTSYLAAPMMPAQSGDISVSPAAMNAPDLWIDDTIVAHFFCSNGLADALRAAKLTSRLPLYCCPILTAN